MPTAITVLTVRMTAPTAVTTVLTAIMTEASAVIAAAAAAVITAAVESYPEQNKRDALSILFILLIFLWILRLPQFLPFGY